MKTNIVRSLIVVFISISLFAFKPSTNWFKAGSAPTKYEMGKDANQNNAFMVKSINNDLDENSFGTYMCNQKPDDLLGYSVRMTASVKSNIESGWAGLWLRIDGRDHNDVLSFDNMQDRPILDEQDWKTYSIILDIPSEAHSMSYGALLAGKGSIWFKDIKFEKVSKISEGSDAKK